LCRRQRITVCILTKSRRPDTRVPQRVPCPAARRLASHLAEAEAEVEVSADRNIEAEFRTLPTFSPNSACLIPSQCPHLPSNP
jgi:hypothetical protein